MKMQEEQNEWSKGYDMVLLFQQQKKNLNSIRLNTADSRFLFTYKTSIHNL